MLFSVVVRRELPCPRSAADIGARSIGCKLQLEPRKWGFVFRKEGSMRFLLFRVGVLGGVKPTAAVLLVVVSLIASSIFSGPLRAASDEAAAAPDSAPDSAGNESDEGFSETVVVTAAIAGVEASKVSASVDVILAEEIEARQANSVAELLATVPGLTVARSGSAGQVTSLFTRGTESDHTLVLWNGIELNNPYFGGFNWAFQPTEGLARVEVVRGPFSALYGSDAVGGVVQMVSGSREGLGLQIEGGENGYARTALQFGLVGESVSFDLAGHVRRGDGELDNDFYDSDEIVARLDWEIGRGMSLGALVRANDSETGIPLSSGFPSPERRIAWEERELSIPFRFEREDWRLEAQLSTVEYDSQFSDPGDAFGFTGSQTESRSIRGRVAATRQLGDSRSLSFGFDTETLEVDDRSVFGVNLDGAEQQTDALFAEWHQEIGAWLFDVGIRYDDNDAFGSETSPRLAIGRNFGGGGRLFLSYGESFRAPSIGELFFPFSGNAELKPEVGRSFEVGYALESKGWDLRVAFFENRLEELIDFDFLTFTNINIGEARTRGLELAVGYEASNWSLRWNGTYLEAEDRGTGLDLLRRPSESSTLVAGWTPSRWSLSAVARYVGDRDDVDPVTFGRAESDSFTTVDLSARWNWSERFSPYARVENLFDREYDEVLGFPAPGQTWIGGIALRY